MGMTSSVVNGDNNHETHVSRKRPRCAASTSTWLQKFLLIFELEKIVEENQQRATKANVIAIPTPTAAAVDQDLLNCPICYQPLQRPVYQCNNGHVVCESCYNKIHNKCPSCSLPIESIRCRAIERLVESATLSCMYAQHGCNEKLSYLKKLDHEKTCKYTPISCPELYCEYVALPKCLYTHFAEIHPSGSKPFTFNTTKYVYMLLDGAHKLFQEKQEKILFVLHRVADPLGSFVNVTCVAPTVSDMKFSYELKAKKGGKIISLESPVKLTLECFAQPAKEKCLLITNDFHVLVNGFKMLYIELVIRKSN